MESTYENPLAYFDYYLDEVIYKEWNQYSSEIIEHIFHSPYDQVDNDSKLLRVFNVEKNNYDIYSFEKHIKMHLDREFLKSKQFIEQGIQNRYSDKRHLKAYITFIRSKLNSSLFLRAIDDFPFLDSKFGALDDNSNHFSRTYVNTTNNTAIYSFTLKSPNGNNSIPIIKKLYQLLNEQPSLITSSQEEFISAFTGQTVEDGIDWLITGKNKKTSKISLFYFIEQLIDKNFIERTVINDLSKHVSYVFRDCNGQELVHLRQSKATFSKSPSQSKRLDSIISLLQE